MTKEKTDNLALWKRVEKTPIKHTKKVNQRGGFTSIAAQYQVMRATEEFGPYGESWGIKSIEYDYLTMGENIMAIGRAVFFIPNGEFAISSGAMAYTKGRADDDFAKKLETDITTKALSKLGFNADVFMGKYDDNKYIAKLKAEDKAVEPKELAILTDELYEQMVPYCSNGRHLAIEKRLSGYKPNKHTEALMLLIAKAKLEDGKEATK